MNEQERIAKFRLEAMAHYEDKLAEEKEQFEVLAISDACIENNGRKVVDDEYAGSMWTDISKQSGLHLHVDYAPGNPQSVFAVLSKEPVPHPNQLYELWFIVEDLKDDDSEWLDNLDFYEGPYKLEVPDLFD